MEYLWCTLGLVLVIEGMPYFISPEKMKMVMAEVYKIPNKYLRLMGLISMLLGAWIIYMSRR